MKCESQRTHKTANQFIQLAYRPDHATRDCVISKTKADKEIFSAENGKTEKAKQTNLIVNLIVYNNSKERGGQ